MTRSTKFLISGLTSLALAAALTPAAFAGDPSSPNSIVGAEGSSASGQSSVNAIVGGDAAQPVSSDQIAAGSLNSIVGADGLGSPQPASTDQVPFSSPNSIVGADGFGSPSPEVATAAAPDGFDWGDAAIGSAVGLALALMLGAVATMRRRGGPTAQASV